MNNMDVQVGESPYPANTFDSSFVINSSRYFFSPIYKKELPVF